MNFGRAVGVAFNTGSNRKLKEGEVDETEQISWGHALAGIAILVLVQLGLIVWGLGRDFDLAFFRDLAIVAFVGLLVPFAVFWIGAALTRTTGRLPGALLYLSIMLAVVQVISAVLTSFGASQSGFVIGIMGASMALGARGFLRVGWVPAIVVALLALAGVLGTGFLLFALPSGRAFT